MQKKSSNSSGVSNIPTTLIQQLSQVFQCRDDYSESEFLDDDDDGTSFDRRYVYFLPNFFVSRKMPSSANILSPSLLRFGTSEECVRDKAPLFECI